MELAMVLKDGQFDGMTLAEIFEELDVLGIDYDAIEEEETCLWIGPDYGDHFVIDLLPDNDICSSSYWEYMED
jgi:hypothetical protein